MAQCIMCLLSTLEDQSSDPQSPCRCQAGTVTSCGLKGRKGISQSKLGRLAYRQLWLWLRALDFG